MPARPRSHRLAAKSVRAFADAVEPRFKFYERPQPEYGIDGEVEEFDDQDRATGLHFFVQIKATDEEKLERALATQLTLETADYYRAAPMPVLMVRYHAPSESVYARWFHQYDPYYGRGGTTTLTFRWASDNRWHADTPAHLSADARAFYDLRAASLRLPRPLHLVTDGAFGLSPAEISIAMRAVAAESADIVTFDGSPPSAGEAWLEICDAQVSVNLGKVTAATLHLPADGSYEGDDRAEQVARDALTLLSLAYERVGQDTIAARLARTYIARSVLASDLDVAFGLSASMARAHRVADALEIADALDEPGDEERSAAGFVYGLAALRVTLTESDSARYEEVLKRRIQRRKQSHPLEAGRATMNLATFQRSRQRFDKAVSHYERAIKLDPAYRDRAHYWLEYGGALWGTGQYDKSVDAYGRAIELGTTEPLALALQADSLLFAGQYRESLETFERFHHQHADEDDGEYRLKTRALRCIIDRLGLERQKRRPGRVLRVVRDIEPKTPQEWEEMSIRQLKEDALWGSAWLNLGVVDQELGREAAGLCCHIASTILIPSDYEAWRNAIFAALVLGEVRVLEDLIVTGRRLGGEELIASLVKRAREIPGPFPLEPFVEIVDEILARSPIPRPRAVLRMLSEGGEVQEIVDADDPYTPPHEDDAGSS